MSIEIELKIEITPQEVEIIKGKLKDNLLKEVYQSTVMFDNESQVMEFTGGRIRVRQHGEKGMFSYKKRLLNDGPEKREIEFETEVGNVEVLTNILRMMGYAPTTSYEKYVTTAEISDVIVEIQCYPFATFIEIEGDEDKIKKLALDLDLDINKATHEAVDTLFYQWRAKNGLPFRAHMNFNDYDK